MSKTNEEYISGIIVVQLRCKMRLSSILIQNNRKISDSTSFVLCIRLTQLPELSRYCLEFSKFIDCQYQIPGWATLDPATSKTTYRAHLDSHLCKIAARFFLKDRELARKNFFSFGEESCTKIFEHCIEHEFKLLQLFN